MLSVLEAVILFVFPIHTGQVDHDTNSQSMVEKIQLKAKKVHNTYFLNQQCKIWLNTQHL